jgi:hypothetical protein
LVQPPQDLRFDGLDQLDLGAMGRAPNAREASLTAARYGPMVTGRTDLARLASHSPA